MNKILDSEGDPDGEHTQLIDEEGEHNENPDVHGEGANELEKSSEKHEVVHHHSAKAFLEAEAAEKYTL